MVVCLVRGVSAPGGGCLVWGGAWSGGAWSGGVAWSGGCLLLRGCAWSGGVLASQHALRQIPPPLWTESQTPVKTLPWPNFVAASNN